MRILAAFATGVLLTAGACARTVDLTTPTDTSEPRATANPSTPAPTTTPTTPLPDQPQIAFDKRNRPKWLDDKIARHLSAKLQNPPIRILSYQYRDQTVFYESAPCCDQYSTLYDIEGNILCRPDGGYTGRGDGECPDFEKKRSNEQLVWEDPRRS